MGDILNGQRRATRFSQTKSMAELHGTQEQSVHFGDEFYSGTTFWMPKNFCPWSAMPNPLWARTQGSGQAGFPKLAEFSRAEPDEKL